MKTNYTPHVVMKIFSHPFLWMYFFILIFTYKGLAQPGSIDTSFGIAGKVVTNLFGYPYAIALKDDGKIIVAGLAYEEVVIVVRYNPDGSLDETFGENGKVLTDLVQEYSFYYSQALAVTVQQDGKIVITGTGYFEDKNGFADYDVLLIRYNEDGTLDETFGNDGIVISNFGSNRDIAYDIVVQPDNKIVITGQINFDLFVARYLPNGVLDSSFAESGYYSLKYKGRSRSIALQNDGKIIAAGGDDKFLLLRLYSSGEIDESFGDKGIVFTNFGYSEQILDIKLQQDGKIIAAGRMNDYSSGLQNMALARYNSNGSLDSSFSEDGLQNLLIEGYNAEATSVLLDEMNNKIIIAGSASKFVVARYNKEGTLNDNFGTGGVQITDFGEPAGGKGAILQTDGKIVVAGIKGSYDFALARYNGNEAETPQITRIKKWLHRHGFTWNDFPRKKATLFKVERSINGTLFYTIASIAGNLSQQQYNYEDPAPLPGMNYYRLTAVSDNGSTVQSNILAIDNSQAAIRLYPNPIKNSVQIEGLPTHQPTKLRITDLNGITRAATTIASSNYTWNIAQLAPGNYILSINTGAGTVARNIIKE